MSQPKSHIFGPVPSRRLGRSLGVDLIPHKTCTYDCLYCQLGPTKTQTVVRKPYVPIREVLSQLETRLKADVQADYITLSGSGEPTLHSGFGEVIQSIKRLTDIPVAVLTNGSLLSDPAVRRDLVRADLVVPSLDAGNAPMFKRVNRPHPDIDFDAMLSGLIRFRQEYSGALWLEVFILQGLTDQEPEVLDLAECAQRVRPDRIQLNTVARPPAHGEAAQVPPETMYRLVGLFGDAAEVVVDYQEETQADDLLSTQDDVFDLLKRRPCTLDDVATSLGLHHNEAIKYLQHLLDQNLIQTTAINQKTYYQSIGGPS